MDHLGHDHEHTHDHPHVHSDMPKDQVVAVLQYMLDHNVHHAGELSDMADPPPAAPRGGVFRPGQRLSVRRPGGAQKVTKPQPKEEIPNVPFHHLPE